MKQLIARAILGLFLLGMYFLMGLLFSALFRESPFALYYGLGAALAVMLVILALFWAVVNA